MCVYVLVYRLITCYKAVLLIKYIVFFLFVVVVVVVMLLLLLLAFRLLAFSLVGF